MENLQNQQELEKKNTELSEELRLVKQENEKLRKEIEGLKEKERDMEVVLKKAQDLVDRINNIPITSEDEINNRTKETDELIKKSQIMREF
jgi:uncharacterized protein YoxC